MKNPLLFIMQVVFSLVTLVSGVVLAELALEVDAVAISFFAMFLVDALLPLAWYWGDLNSRVVVDRYFTFTQIIWHMLLSGVFVKYIMIFPQIASYAWLVIVATACLFVFRLIAQNSFLKQER